jgi:tetrathionate reductase subunit A
MRSIYPVTQWPFLLMSFKSTIHSSYSLDSSLSSLQEENPVLLNPRDAQRLKIKQGDRVKISTPAGSINSAVLIDPGVKSGVLAIEHGFGHRDLGARTIIINGTKIPGNPHARHGVNLNEIGLTDPTRKGTTLWVNSVSGACVRNGIPAKIEVQKV